MEKLTMGARYRANKAFAVTLNTDPVTGEILPSDTDQAGARETDINVIVGKMLKTGVVPGNGKEGEYGDFSELPEDLRDMIHLTREMPALQKKLPSQLGSLTLQQLMDLTPEQANAIMNPPAPTPEKRPEPPKEEK